MKIRTCPNCGYKYPLSEYLRKFLFKFIDSNWNCPECGSELTFHAGRRTWVAFIGVLPIAFSSFFKDIFISLGLSERLSLFAYILIFIIWMVIAFSFDAFTLIKKSS